MSRRVKKEGFILKEGGHVYARSQRRYFVLEGRALTYYDGPSRSKEHGSIDLAPERCEVRDHAHRGAEKHAKLDLICG